MLMNLIFLHGWGHSAQMWQDFASKFHTDQVLVLDLPGFGAEKLQSESWDIPHYADWVEKYVQEHKLKKVILIGHSFGGRIASLIASKNPSWLSAVILVAAPSLYRPSKNVKTKTGIYKLLKPLLPSSLRQRSYPSELKEAGKNNLDKIWRNTVRFDQTDQIIKIKAPTLIIWGDNDTESSIKIGYEMHRLIKNSKLEVLKSIGHNIYLENPNLLYGIINNFVQNI